VPIKKSDLYSSLWASCDELRGGMDANQYKDYVLFMLFIKYITDKYGNSSDFASPVTIPESSTKRFNEIEFLNTTGYTAPKQGSTSRLEHFGNRSGLLYFLSSRPRTA
jgi:type I restriction-modification system DNA methylase subunit